MEKVSIFIPSIPRSIKLASYTFDRINETICPSKNTPAYISTPSVDFNTYQTIIQKSNKGFEYQLAKFADYGIVESIRLMASKIDTRYLLFWMDDRPPLGNLFNPNKFWDLVNAGINSDIDYLRLNRFGPIGKSSNYIEPYHDKFGYQLSFTVALIRREWLISILQPELSIWEHEKNPSNKLMNIYANSSICMPSKKASRVRSLIYDEHIVKRGRLIQLFHSRASEICKYSHPRAPLFPRLYNAAYNIIRTSR